jgi:hypothetical protein
VRAFPNAAWLLHEKPGAALVSRPRAAGASEAGFVGEDHELDAVAEPELLQHARDVCLDHGCGEVKLCADFGIRGPARDESDHVAINPTSGGDRQLARSFHDLHRELRRQRLDVGQAGEVVDVQRFEGLCACGRDA